MINEVRSFIVGLSKLAQAAVILDFVNLNQSSSGHFADHVP